MVHGGHPLAVGVEGLLEQTGIGFLQVFMVNAEGLGQVDQCPLRGVADDLARVIGVQAGVVAEGGGIDQFLIDLGVTLGRLRDRGALAGCKVPVDGDVGDRHLVQGQGACLVAADNRGAAQGFHRGQLADQGIFLGHTLHAQRHNDGGGGGQALRDDGDGQRDGHQELWNQRPVVQGTEKEDQDTDN